MYVMRTIEWDDKQKQVKIIDQRLLPGRLEYVLCSTWQDIAQSIKNMSIRGAPAIGVAAAYGMALVDPGKSKNDRSVFLEELRNAANGLLASRPTAINLSWAINKMLKIAESSNLSPDEINNQLRKTAEKIADADIETNKNIGLHGATLIDDGDTIIHHCNTGALATVDWGTALGAIRTAHEQGKRVHVLVDETRPRLQGARLTAWELSQMGISFEIITDNAAGYFLRKGEVHKVMFGADRVTANGDVINKIGTYMLALAAHENHVPVYSLFPSSSVDLTKTEGDFVQIEERDQREVLDLQFDHSAIAPKGAKARNPAFDVTPHELLTALVTEYGIVQPPYQKNLARLLGKHFEVK